jgi:site-specific DNA recombinase
MWSASSRIKTSSAFNRTVRRAEFERLVSTVRSREIDGVLAYRVDRIARRLHDFVKLHDACEDAGAFIVTTGDGIDTSTDGGRFVAPILVQIGNQESRNQSTRIRRKRLEEAQQGRQLTGGYRLFGFTQDRTAIVEDEAALVREAASRLLGGESLNGVCRDWQRRGIRTVTGKGWAPFHLKRFLMTPALSGQRALWEGEVQRGRLNKARDLVTVKGEGPAILTADETRRLRYLLTDPYRRVNDTARRYLLSGMLMCGRCGERMVSRPRADKVRTYRCSNQAGRVSCGKISRLAGPVEDVVKESVLVALYGVSLAEYMDRPEDKTAEIMEAIRRDEGRLNEMAVDYADGRFGRAEWYAARDHLNARLEANRSALQRQNGHGLLNTFVGAAEEVRKQWDVRDLDWQRAVIKAVVDHVVIESAVKGRKTFNPSLVRIVWKF